MANSMTFGKKLKMLRVGKGLTQDEMASELGITRRAYIPYEQDKARPRNEATYQKMAEILDCDVHELTDLLSEPASKNDLRTAGTAAFIAAVGSLVPFVGAAIFPFAAGLTGAAGVAAASATAATAARVAGVAGVAGASIAAASTARAVKGNKPSKEEALPTNNVLEYNNDMLLQYTNRQKKFQATAQGILYPDLSQKRIEFLQGNLRDLEDHGGKPDAYITVLNNSIHSWWFSFWAKDPELDKHVIISPEERAGVMISRYTTAAFDPHRKISIVVDDDELFENLIAYRNHNCFHGNMTAILVDVENVMIVKEEAIAELATPSELEKTEITTEA